MTPSAALVDAFRAGMAEAAAPGVTAALVADGAVAWQGTWGVGDAASGAPMDAQTACPWFSMTKIATATAVMQLVDGGAVELERPARDYLPDLDDLDRRITIHQLLNHSSGLANPLPIRWIHPAAGDRPEPMEMLRRLLARHGRPRFEPGARSAYSNVGFLALGEVIGAASGLPYRRYVVERVLRPLGAGSTGFTYHEPGVGKVATGHHPRRDPTFPVFRLLLPRWVVGSTAGRWRQFNPFLLDGSAYGGLVGPVGDAALLAAAHLGDGAAAGERILSPGSTRRMREIDTPGRKLDLGLGWFRRHADSEAGRAHVEHLGGGPAFGTVMRLWPERGIGAVVMANVSSDRFRHERALAALEPVDAAT